MKHRRKNGIFDIRIDYENEKIYDGEVPARNMDNLFDAIRRKFL